MARRRKRHSPKSRDVGYCCAPAIGITALAAPGNSWRTIRCRYRPYRLCTGTRRCKQPPAKRKSTCRSCVPLWIKRSATVDRGRVERAERFVLHYRSAGILVSAIRPVVTDASGSFEYEIEVDVDEYIRRGNPYKTSPLVPARTGVRESISINSDDIVAGRTPVQTVHAKPGTLTKEAAAALD